MTPEERKRQELRAKAGLPVEGAAPAPMQELAPHNLNITNAPPGSGATSRKHAELRAKAGLDAAPAQPAVDPSLQNYRVPDRMLGLSMPYAGGETDYMTSSGQGFGLSMPRHAPPAVQGAIAEGVSHGHDRRKKRAGLAARGAVTSRAGGTPGSISHAVGLLTGDPGRQNFETYERAGAVQTGIEDVNTFGLSDEISGMVGGEDALNAQRQMVKDAYHIHPASTIAGGSTAMIIPGQGIRGASTGARVLSGMARGGIFGAAYGAGSGEGLADRATKAAGYGAFGGVLGGGFVLGGRGLDYAGRKILGSAELRSVASHLFGRGSNPSDIKLVESAITEMQRAARVEGRSLARDEAKRELMAALGRAEMNDMIGDVIPGGVTSMEGSALPGMEGADMVVRSLRERGEGQYERINAAVGQIVQGEDIAGSLANLARIKDEEAQPLYQAAFGADKRIDPNHERFGELNRLLQLPDFQTGKDAGERLMRIARRDPEAQFSQLNPFEQLDWIKKGLDAEIGKLLRAGDNTTAGALIDAKNTMLAIADDMNPTYGQARQVWAGAQAQQDALLLGESLFSATGQVKTGPAMREIRRQYESYSEAEKTAFSIGLFEKAMDSIGTVIESGTANSAKRGFLSPNSEAALREFLPAEQADEFLSMIQREYRQQMNANQALAGSPTGRRIKAGEAVRMATGGVRAAAAELSDPQGLIRKGQQYLRDTIGNNPTVQRRFAEFLTTDATDSRLQRALGPEPGQGQGTLPPRTVTTPALRGADEMAEQAPMGQGVPKTSFSTQLEDGSEMRLDVFTDPHKGALVVAPDYPSNAIGDAAEAISRQLGEAPPSIPRVDDGPIGMREAANKAADQFEQIIRNNPRQTSYVLSLPDDPRVRGEMAARLHRLSNDLLRSSQGGRRLVLVSSRDGGDLALVDQALTRRGGVFSTEPATLGQTPNWVRIRSESDYANAVGSYGADPIITNGIGAESLMLPARLMATNGTVIGGVGGGVHGFMNPSDFDGDGEITSSDRRDTVIRNAMIGALGGRSAKGPLKKMGIKPFEMAATSAAPAAAATVRQRASEVLTQRSGGYGSIRDRARHNPDLSAEDNARELQYTLHYATETLKDELGVTADEALELAQDIMDIKLDPAVMRQALRQSDSGITDDEITRFYSQYFGYPADPIVTNGIGGVRRKEVMQGLAGDQFPAAEGSVPRRAPEPQPAGIAGTSDELRGHPLIDDGMTPTGQSDWYDVQVARPMMVEKLVNEGMDPAQARATVDQMGDDVVAALSEQELITARGRYPVGADRDAGVNGQIAGILGAIGLGGGYMAMQGSESPNAMSDILASADQATRSGRGLPQTPSLKPSDAMTALLERPDTIAEGDALEVTEEDKARGVRAKRVDEDGTVYEFIGGQWRKAK